MSGFKGRIKTDISRWHTTKYAIIPMAIIMSVMICLFCAFPYNVTQMISIDQTGLDINIKEQVTTTSNIYTTVPLTLERLH